MLANQSGQLLERNNLLMASIIGLSTEAILYVLNLLPFYFMKDGRIINMDMEGLPLQLGPKPEVIRID